MEGQVVSHYRVLEKLGGGGMGVVYKARDLRLGRFVALKFLPPELTRDAEANLRFGQEAKAASALDHANICTIYEIGVTEAGQTFLAMAFYDGGTLKKRVEKGPLGTDEVIDIAIAIARGLSRAHESGIVHRDIKPANVMVTNRDEVKILDFGIAKLVGQAGLTRTGSTVGTDAYMAPEVLAGAEADQRSDLWALGVVLHEMLSGERPFRGQHVAAITHAILHSTPTPLRELRADIPESLEEVVTRALRKDPDERYESADEMIADLVALRAGRAPRLEAGSEGEAGRRPKVAVSVAVAVMLLSGAAGLWGWSQSSQASQARNEVLPEIERLIGEDDYSGAFILAEEAEEVIGGDPALVELWREIARTVEITTTPAEATVSIAFYTQQKSAGWRSLGETPIMGVRLPREAVHLRLEKPGFETVELLLRRGGTAFDFTLDESGTIPTDMVRVPAGDKGIQLAAFDDFPPVYTPSYLIDKQEVTNREFEEFVDAGGYRDQRYWKHAFVENGRELSWNEAMSRFRDRSGRPGPATWEGGTYAAGEEDYPVAGVSWYEAAAYAEFRGRSLPTVFHWLGATATGQATFILPLSNFSPLGLRPVGATLPGPNGTYDMAGNVKEWCFNETGADRYILGAAWNEPTYLFFEQDARPPLDRSENNGFRTADYLDAEPIELEASMRPIERAVRDYAVESPASDELYRAYAAQFSYDQAPLDVVPEGTDDSSPYWRREIVSYTAAYGGERMSAHFFVPRDVSPPYQTVIYFPGSSAIRQLSSDDMGLGSIDLVVKSGRAVLWPVYKDTYERSTGLEFTDPNPTRAYVEHVIWWIKDVRRSIDYLETRPDVDLERLGYLGQSWGARIGNIALAVEPRLRAGLLIAGGFPLMHSQPEVAEITFAARVTAPLLLVTGTHDRVFPYGTSQRPMYEHLGTPEAEKRWIRYDATHGVRSEFRRQVYQDIQDFLDDYFGPVG